MIAYYSGVVKFESLKKLDQYNKYSVCVSLDDNSMAALKANGYKGNVGEENSVFFNRPHETQFPGEDQPTVFGPVVCVMGEEGKEEPIEETPGKGSTVIVKVQHYLLKSGPKKGTLGTKLDKVKVLELIESDWDDRPF